MLVQTAGTGQQMLSIYRHSNNSMIASQDGLSGGDKVITFNISNVYYSDAIDIIFTQIGGQVYEIWLE